MAELGVNIDHVATVREARKTNEPDPVWAAAAAELGGADSITIHLREDRRHIQDRDLRIIRETTAVKLNLELACVPAMLDIACETLPDQVTLVPEKRQEITTEGGLDIRGHMQTVRAATQRLQDAGILVSLFIDPDDAQVEATAEAGATAVELHTGSYANARGEAAIAEQMGTLNRAATAVRGAGLVLHAGHGLTYRNVRPVAQIPGMCELNIGHSIIARSIFVGLTQAVREMKALIQ